MTVDVPTEYPMGPEEVMERERKMLKCPKCMSREFRMFADLDADEMSIECTNCRHHEDFDRVQLAMSEMFIEWDVQEVERLLADLNQRLQKVEKELFWPTDSQEQERKGNE